MTEGTDACCRRAGSAGRLARSRRSTAGSAGARPPVGPVRRRRRLGLAAVLVASALSATACGGAAAPAAKAPATSASSSGAATSATIPMIPAGHPVTITTAYSVPSAIFAPLWIGVQNGYFKQYGLTVKPEMVEGPTQMAGIVSGSIPIGNTGDAEILDARAQGTPAIGLLEATHYAVFELHAAPQYKTVQSLKGKTVAITKAGSSTDMATLALLAQFGLSPAKGNVKILPTGGMPSILAAMEKGVAQAGVMSPPTTVRADKAGFPLLASTFTDKVALQQNMLVTTASYAKAHPAVVYAYMMGYLKGLAFFFKHPNQSIAIIAKYTKAPSALAKAAYDAVAPAMVKVPLITNDGFRTAQKYDANPKVKTMNPSQAHDDTFLKTLIASGFLKKVGLQ